MSLTCYKYQLPFNKPLTTSTRIYNNREGWIFCWEEAGKHYFGEAAPLPGFSVEGIQEIQTFIHQYIKEWTQLLKHQNPTQPLSNHYKEENLPPALQFVLDSLAYQLEAHRSHEPLTHRLFDASASSTIAVNGLVSLLDEKEVLGNIQALVKDGFQTIKCKIGQHFLREKENLTKIRATFPDLHIRLDANQAWELTKAIGYLSELEPLDIQYWEEPLAQPTPEYYCMLSQKTNISLALDESINTSASWEMLLPYASVLIIKPMLIGSFNRLLDIKRKADESNCALVFTSSLESSVGRGITALLASGLGSQQYAHGLSTGTRLAHDTIPDYPFIQQGCIQIDNQLLPIKADLMHLEHLSTKSITSS